MFKQLFATMNQALDEIIRLYPSADLSQLTQLDEELLLLKNMSDACIEEWLQFEEKMAKLFQFAAETLTDDEMFSAASPAMSPSDPVFDVDTFSKAQGFYKLFMFKQAVTEFEKIVKQHPDFLLARTYLAMGYLQMGEDSEAYRHFQFLLPLTDNAQLKAISYNAMGCIQVKLLNLEKAFEYFTMAIREDPTCIEPPVKAGVPQSKKRLP